MRLHPAVTILVAFTLGACLDARQGRERPHASDPDASDANDASGADDAAPDAVASGPHIVVSPTRVDFGAVAIDTTATRSIAVSDGGDEPLLIDGFALAGHPDFAVVIDGRRYDVTADSASGLRLSPPLAIEPGASVSIDVSFSAHDAYEASGQLTLFSNDPAARAGTVIALHEGGDVPCIQVAPSAVDFGAQLVGRQAMANVKLTSCGSTDLEVRGIALTSESSPRFGIALTSLPDAPNQLGSGDAPLVLHPNASLTFAVTYTAAAVDQVDSGRVAIRTNTSVPEVDVDLRGHGVAAPQCPTAVIGFVAGGDEVVPQRVLHLAGSLSTGAPTPIAAYHWSVEQPVGAVSKLLPSADAKNPNFEVDVAGRYVFHLTVTDQNGLASCTEATREVMVVPDKALHIELLWDTPADPDQTDDSGADLDLHFKHPNAIGNYDGDGDGVADGWFDIGWDCFWGTPNPNWGTLDGDDNPSLDRVDHDGAGPENLNAADLEAGVTYALGVNYWNDHNRGPSFATVRIYFYGSLAFEVKDIELAEYDMWWVTNITWPPESGTPQLITVCGDDGCAPKIAHDYHNPYFPQ